MVYEIIDPDEFKKLDKITQDILQKPAQKDITSLVLYMNKLFLI